MTHRLAAHALADRDHAAPPSVRHLLHDPDSAWHALTGLVHRLLDHLAALAPELAVGVLAVALAARLLGRLRDRRASCAGRLIDIGVPPDVDPDGALLVWSALHDLLRPRLRRLLGGQPHLCWEIAAGRDGTAFRIWIPQSVPPGLVERALTAAWPGATITETDTTSESESEADDADRVQLATELVLSGSECFPLGGGDGPDPLGLVLAQLAGLGDREEALVQVLAQPATSRHQRQLLTVARRLRAGIPTSRLARLIDPFHAGAAGGPPDPTVSPDVRAVLEKASRPLYRCLVRVTVTTPKRQAARGRIHALAGAFAAYEGRVGLRRRRARHHGSRAAAGSPRLPALGARARRARAPAGRPGRSRRGARGRALRRPVAPGATVGQAAGRHRHRSAAAGRGQRHRRAPAPARARLHRCGQVDADRPARPRRRPRRPRRGRHRPQGRPRRRDPRTPDHHAEAAGRHRS